MAAAALISALCEETTCPVCLEYFTEPVTLDCGHNFCRACISRYWEAFDPAATCPQCREISLPRDLRPNRQLANVIEIVKKLEEGKRAAAGHGEKRGSCERHREPPKFFFREDEALLCGVCDREHQDHPAVPVEEVAPKCKEVGSTLCRYEERQERQVMKCSPGLEERLGLSSQKHTALQEAIENCQELLNQALNKVNVTLDPDTANPFLILSEDLKNVRRGSKCQGLPDTPQRFDIMMCVLGRERFTSGRHWWEVEVEENLGRWAVGVARGSVRRKGLVPVSPDQGLWAVGQSFSYFSSPCQILAFTSPKPTPLTLRHKLRKIRVSLDYGRGRVEFLDGDTNDLIFAFLSASFSGEGIRPFFRVWKGARLKC